MSEEAAVGDGERDAGSGVERWRSTTRARAVAASAERREAFATTSEIPVHDVYTAEDLAGRDLAGDLGLGAAVSFVGHAEPGPLLDTADVLVQLSVWENCSYSLLDALVHGVGAVATPVGGNPEILPASALVAHDDHQGVARSVVAQGLDPAARPSLPAGWPDRASMCAEVAEVYRTVRSRS